MSKHSPHLNLLNSTNELKKYIEEYRKSHKNPSFLDVGGRRGIRKDYAAGFRYIILEINKELNAPNIICGDICNCPQISDESYDIVFSNNVFEHIKTPWLAANECVRITKSGGLNIHTTPFAWRYHPDPVDCFRYTHTGMKMLFEQSDNMEEVLSGYDISDRRKNHPSNELEKGGHFGGNVKGGLDLVPIDELGGWREHWRVIYIGRKI